MQKYQVIEKAGNGNFSDVYKAIQLSTGETVAIKDMRKVEEIQQLAVRELKILESVNHPNIIRTKQIIKNGTDIKVVFEYVSENLLELYENAKKGVSENQIKCILYQTAFALEYLHTEKKIIHRDIKPQNILIDKKQAIVKLIDFGLAKQEELAGTNYVATRWYRAPQNIVGMRRSTTAIDIFSLACVIFQLATLTPLFPGQNSVDQLAKIFDILGSPTEQIWPAGFAELNRKGIGVLPRQRVDLKTLMPNSSDQLVDLLDTMLALDPYKRPRARQIMQHPFFSKVQRVIPVQILKQAQNYLKQIKNKRTRKLSLNEVAPPPQIQMSMNTPRNVIHFKNDHPIPDNRIIEPVGGFLSPRNYGPSLSFNHHVQVARQIQAKNRTDASKNTKGMVTKQISQPLQFRHAQKHPHFQEKKPIMVPLNHDITPIKFVTIHSNQDMNSSMRSLNNIHGLNKMMLRNTVSSNMSGLVNVVRNSYFTKMSH